MKYKAYEVTLRQYENGYFVHWRIRDPDTGYYYSHRVGGPAHVHYNSEGSVLAQTWALDDVMYLTEAEYQKALKAWLG